MGNSQACTNETFSQHRKKLNETLLLKSSWFQYYFLSSKKGLKEGNWRIAGCYLNEIQNEYNGQFALAYAKKASNKNSIDGIIFEAIASNDCQIFQKAKILDHPYAQFWRAKYHFYTVHAHFFPDKIIQCMLKSAETESSVASEMLNYLSSHKYSFNVDENVKEKLVKVATAKIGSECSFFIEHEKSTSLWPIP
jgi:hypothetical protein